MIPALYMEAMGDSAGVPLFERLYYTYRGQMFGVANHTLHNYHDAEEAVQDAFLGVARNIATVQKLPCEAAVRTYLLRAAQNAATNRALKERPDTELYEEAVSRDDTLWEQLCAELLHEELVALISALPPIYREVLHYHLMGLTAQEIGELLQLRRETAKRRISRGKELLRTALIEKGWNGHGQL